MTRPDKRPESAAELRRRAEAIFRETAAQSSENLAELSPEAIGRMLHELRVHQIELEIQNEELRRAQAELDASRARYFDLYDLAPVGYCSVGESGLILQANLTAANLLGVARGNLVKQLFSRFILKDDHVTFYQQRKELLDSGEAQSFELRMLRSDGTFFWARLACALTHEAERRVIRIVLSDDTEHRLAEEYVRQQALHDDLTSLPNRRLFNDRLSQSMAASKRSGCYGALMFLDLDNFKTLNDAHGHVAGDALLIEAADRLTSCVREIDTVARFGGDEFVVIINGLDVNRADSQNQAELIANKMCLALSDAYRLTINAQGKAQTTVDHLCTVSIGVVLFNNHDASYDELLKGADAAMYQAKEAGRNAVRFYE